ncbi:MAG TPA: response regulator [Bacteroidales bacterium]|nr:response regulator [Bacteroidales bacterium]
MDVRHVLSLEDVSASSFKISEKIKDLIPGCSVKVVRTREAYVESLENAWPDLIITAFPVTGFDGITALRLRKGLAPEIPMIILGETPDAKEKNFLHDAGINDMIVWESPDRLQYALEDLINIGQKRKERGEELKAEQEAYQLLQKILRKIPSGIYIFEPATQSVEYFNTFFAGQLGYTKEEAEQKGKNFFAEVCHHSDLKNFSDHLLAFDTTSNGNVYEHDLRMRHKNGTWRWIHTFNVLYSKAVSGQECRFLGAAQDITIRRQLDDELTHAKLEAEKANGVKTAFLRNFSHYLRTPMNAVYGFATLLEEKELPQAVVQNYLGIIRENSEALLNLINSLIDISLLETHQLPMFPQKFSLNQLLCGLKEELVRIKELKEKKQIFLTVHPVPETVPDELFYDPDRLKQIFGILLSNAVRHTEAGEIAFGYHSVDEQWFTFFVSDTGCGIPPEKQTSIFEPFHAAETGAEKSSGPGLGLAICSRLISLTGGRIWFSSKPVNETTFWFSIPRGGLQNNKEVRRYRNLMLDYDLQGTHVLVVDDHEESRFYYREVLESRGIIVHEATNMMDAWKILLSEPEIRIILLDIFLPDGNGIDLAVRVKEKRKDIRIIAQTAYASEEDRTKCLGAGCDDYLTKPIGKEELVFRIALQMKGTYRNGIFSGRFAQVTRNQKG